MALYDLNNEFDREKFRTRVDTLLNDRSKVELTKKHPTRSLPQNSYCHLLLGYFASEFGYSIEEVKTRFFKQEANRDIFEYDYENRRGQNVKRLRSSTALNTAEMTTAIERFRNLSASKYGLYLPAPGEEEALFYAQKQFEAYREFV